MSTEFEKQINPNSSLATAGGATLIVTPIGAATAGDLLASGMGSLGSEAAGQDHSPDPKIGPADLPEHGLNGGLSPPPPVLDHAATVDASPVLDHAAVAALVHEVV